MKTRSIEAEYPNIGDLIDVGGYRMNSVHVKATATANLPPVIFIHGASGNLRDQVFAFRRALEGRAEMLFVDRPGHGYSERGGPENAFPDGQAAALAALMDKRGIAKAIISGHSFGAAIAASFALEYPERTSGLLFLAPATHPWPGGVDWYYTMASLPGIGWLFSRTIVLPLGLPRIEAGTEAIFHPNRRPKTYIPQTGPALVLRPDTFRHNAVDVVNLHGYVTRIAPHYRDIRAPTVIITGDSDRIVLEEIHSQGLARDIVGSELVRVRHLGHKPDYVVTDLAVAALEKIAGKTRDLQAWAARSAIFLDDDGPTHAGVPFPDDFDRASPEQGVYGNLPPPSKEASTMQTGGIPATFPLRTPTTVPLPQPVASPEPDKGDDPSAMQQVLAFIKKSAELDSDERKVRAKEKLEAAKAQLDFLRRWGFDPEIVARQASQLGSEVAGMINRLGLPLPDASAASLAMPADGETQIAARQEAAAEASEDAGDGPSFAQKAYREMMSDDDDEIVSTSAQDIALLQEYTSIAAEIRTLLEEALRQLRQQQTGSEETILQAQKSTGSLDAAMSGLRVTAGTFSGSAAQLPASIII